MRLAHRGRPREQSQVVIEAVRGLGDMVGGLALGPVAGALRPLLPELAAWLPGAPYPLDGRVGERHRCSVAWWRCWPR